ncbi:hypothetical protein [Methylopila turkensis]|uniref:Lipoprotein n=1 Tax=Methylopila turkensis TaxID=1437816 RepID=A0A9W6JNF8_9HYPH|nr:hypothetical protein [Methylopila turkensis]GLK80850.1 hypothetical protein GCM10008174_25910 [Methylopila turkensis]
MSVSRPAFAVVLVAGCGLLLGGCDLEKYRGTRGLPPAPDNLAYPNVNVTPPQRPGTLRTPEEQKKLEADLLARKRR